MKKHRLKEVKIRLSNEEYQELISRKNKPLATWIRETCLTAKPGNKAVKTIAIDPALLRQLAGIGNNINQIARRLNQVKNTEKIDVLALLLDLERELNNLKEIHQ